jgi:hypothetical protein
MALSRRVRLMLLPAGIVVVLVAVALPSFYFAARHVPDFYREALETDPDVLERGSDRMLQQATALSGAVKREGNWEVLFTAEQINGWLAVDMPKNHPGLLPPAMRDPRAIVHPKGVTLACRYDPGWFPVVLSLTIEPYVSEPNVLAIRFVGARAGLLPFPLGGVIDRFTEAARNMDWQVEWRRAGDDPVAMISIPAEDERRPMRLKKFRLGEGEVFVSGSTEAKKSH